ncbi:MAG: hypothetical protein LUI10_10360 [Lachnospiraceae bacterium]|nr:hypothetical protein [Lachnospiraceae bacterium]
MMVRINPIPMKQKTLKSVSAFMRHQEDFTIRRLHSTAMIYLIISFYFGKYRKIWLQSSHPSHFQYIKDRFFSAILAFRLYMAFRVAKNHDGAVAAVGAFDNPRFLLRDCLPCPYNLFLNLRRRFSDSDIPAHDYTSNPTGY